jgi:hypothetical protein
MLALNKPDYRKVREMSFSHSQLLNADQPPKKVAFTRIIALVAMISGLLSFVLSFIFDFVSRLFHHMTPQVSCPSKKCMAGFARHNSYISSAEG